MKTLFMVTIAMWVLVIVMFSVGPWPEEDGEAWVPIVLAVVSTIVLVVCMAVRIVTTGAL